MFDSLVCPQLRDRGFGLVLGVPRHLRLTVGPVSSPGPVPLPPAASLLGSALLLRAARRARP